MNEHAENLLLAAEMFDLSYTVDVSDRSKQLREAADEIERFEARIKELDYAVAKRIDEVASEAAMQQLLYARQVYDDAVRKLEAEIKRLEALVAEQAAALQWAKEELSAAKSETEKVKHDRNRIGMEIRGEYLPKLAAMQKELEASKKPKVCEWKQDEDGNWHTGCGNIHVLLHGTPSDNKMAWCCSCSGKVVEK